MTHTAEVEKIIDSLERGQITDAQAARLLHDYLAAICRRMEQAAIGTILYLYDPSI